MKRDQRHLYSESEKRATEDDEGDMLGVKQMPADFLNQYRDQLPIEPIQRG